MKGIGLVVLGLVIGLVLTISINLAGLPGASIPCGFDAQGLPIGLQVVTPTLEEARLLRVCAAYDLTLSPDVLSYLLEDFYPSTRTPLAGFHPKFIVEHVVARCSFESVPTELTVERVRDALRNLVIGDLPDFD